MKDLTALAERVEAVFEEELGTEEGGRIALAIALTLPPNYDECHWVTNVDRAAGIRLFFETAEKMLAQVN